MPPLSITPSDLEPFADIEHDKAQAMCDDGLALAKSVAPCLKADDLDADTAAAAKAVLRGAILRRNDAGNGAIVEQVAGPFGQTIDTRHARRPLLWPSEIEALQKLCRDLRGLSGAWDYDVTPEWNPHVNGCTWQTTGDDCTCGFLLLA
ncbi:MULTISPECIES: hypothetical protein [Mycobacteriaceae]|uniref:Uncharacterized protein n=1 Tax=Mycolicibacillus parakoreensis TaxID=1069221 RepID=A0ABY3TXC4_9MYCO|nr:MULTISPECIES: hypothetical protein [Mycobacteriaceae]MCV7317259.1 hypothetical protein [Mycolicibacillus parakoreensis]ULN51529.1 hypothetical protein MIU77_11485 [Mycolicibacillus parakoreensis]